MISKPHERVQLIIKKGNSRTKQAFKKDCDINMIMKRFKKVMNEDYLKMYNSYAGGQFLDVSQVTDYKTALEMVRSADDIFARLPAEVRKRFSNDAAVFLDFCADEKNKPEMVAMGLAPEQPVETKSETK